MWRQCAWGEKGGARVPGRGGGGDSVEGGGFRAGRLAGDGGPPWLRVRCGVSSAPRLRAAGLALALEAA